MYLAFRDFIPDVVVSWPYDASFWEPVYEAQKDGRWNRRWVWNASK